MPTGCQSEDLVRGREAGDLFAIRTSGSRAADRHRYTAWHSHAHILKFHTNAADEQSAIKVPSGFLKSSEPRLVLQKCYLVVSASDIICPFCQGLDKKGSVPEPTLG